ncbi:hypothetical protein BST92_02815 [Nonlabens arenilitoris]|uniref:DUF3347 domain-containing protein n=1 Tax=Nonlabens arenilitoris TaxID=1217969 RepID=A0A2S7U7G2_9FLAO|nr:DUF3347 domain-containing protein [Nonlabens arenilitoris]PQJ30926.1 hypothetical protein BST92_02815 [Nonlabens arenilitoris]
MKKLFKTVLTVIAITTLIACKNEAKTKNANEETVETSKTELTFSNPDVKNQFRHYIHLKTALVNSDVSEAKSGAKMLMENTDDAQLKNMLSKISDARDIEEQRTIFSSVTEKMTAIVDESIKNGEVYKQFCPMAFNNEGGYWLSTEREIRNPYFGDKMLKCGKVSETIK